MSTTTTKLIQKLWNKCTMSVDTKYQGSYAMRMNVGILELYHYGTLILTIKNDVPTIGGAYSNSDRDAINSVLVLHCLDDKYRASTSGGTVHLVEL